MRAKSREVAARAVEAWESVHSQLAPVIGEDGFRVLYSRSLHRARQNDPWLARGAGAVGKPFQDLHASLASQTPESAEKANRGLHATFKQMLGELIGDVLVARLLDPVNGPAR